MSSPASPFLVRLSINCSPKFTFYTSSAILLRVFAQRLTLQPIHIKKKTHNIFICFFFRRRHAQNASTSHSNGVSTYIHFAVFFFFFFFFCQEDLLLRIIPIQPPPLSPVLTKYELSVLSSVSEEHDQFDGSRIAYKELCLSVCLSVCLSACLSRREYKE